MSRRKYTIRREAGLHLTDRQRELLGTAWNGYVNRCARISLRLFARIHNVPYATWQRELRRGAASPIIRQGNRWTYPEYDIGKARASINEGRSNMGAPMKLTVGMAILFRHAVLELGGYRVRHGATGSDMVATVDYHSSGVGMRTYEERTPLVE